MGWFSSVMDGIENQAVKRGILTDVDTQVHEKLAKQGTLTTPTGSEAVVTDDEMSGNNKTNDTASTSNDANNSNDIREAHSPFTRSPKVNRVDISTPTENHGGQQVHAQNNEQRQEQQLQAPNVLNTQMSNESAGASHVSLISGASDDEGLDHSQRLEQNMLSVLSGNGEGDNVSAHIDAAISAEAPVVVDSGINAWMQQVEAAPPSDADSDTDVAEEANNDFVSDSETEANTPKASRAKDSRAYDSDDDTELKHPTKSVQAAPLPAGSKSVNSDQSEAYSDAVSEYNEDSDTDVEFVDEFGNVIPAEELDKGLWKVQSDGDESPAHAHEDEYSSEEESGSGSEIEYVDEDGNVIPAEHIAAGLYAAADEELTDEDAVARGEEQAFAEDAHEALDSDRNEVTTIELDPNVQALSEHKQQILDTEVDFQVYEASGSESNAEIEGGTTPPIAQSRPLVTLLDTEGSESSSFNRVAPVSDSGDGYDAELHESAENLATGFNRVAPMSDSDSEDDAVVKANAGHASDSDSEDDAVVKANAGHASDSDSEDDAVVKANAGHASDSDRDPVDEPRGFNRVAAMSTDSIVEPQGFNRVADLSTDSLGIPAGFNRVTAMSTDSLEEPAGFDRVTAISTDSLVEPQGFNRVAAMSADSVDEMDGEPKGFNRMASMSESGDEDLLDFGTGTVPITHTEPPKAAARPMPSIVLDEAPTERNESAELKNKTSRNLLEFAEGEESLDSNDLLDSNDHLSVVDSDSGDEDPAFDVDYVESARRNSEMNQSSRHASGGDNDTDDENMRSVSRMRYFRASDEEEAVSADEIEDVWDTDEYGNPVDADGRPLGVMYSNEEGTVLQGGLDSVQEVDEEALGSQNSSRQNSRERGDYRMPPQMVELLAVLDREREERHAEMEHIQKDIARANEEKQTLAKLAETLERDKAELKGMHAAEMAAVLKSNAATNEAHLSELEALQDKNEAEIQALKSINEERELVVSGSTEAHAELQERLERAHEEISQLREVIDRTTQDLADSLAKAEDETSNATQEKQKFAEKEMLSQELERIRDSHTKALMDLDESQETTRDMESQMQVALAKAQADLADLQASNDADMQRLSEEKELVVIELGRMTEMKDRMSEEKHHAAAELAQSHMGAEAAQMELAEVRDILEQEIGVVSELKALAAEIPELKIKLDIALADVDQLRQKLAIAEESHTNDEEKEKLRDLVEETSRKLQASEADAQETHAKLADLEATVSRLEADVERAEAEVEKSQEQIQALQKETDRARQENEGLTSELEEVRSERASAQQQAEAATARSVELDNRVHELLAKTIGLQEALQELEGESDGNTAALQDECAALEKANIELEERYSALEARSDELMATLAEAETRKGELQDRKADLESRNTELANRVTELEVKLQIDGEERSHLVAENERELDALKKERDELYTESEFLTKQCEALEQKCLDLESRLNEAGDARDEEVVSMLRWKIEEMRGAVEATHQDLGEREVFADAQEVVSDDDHMSTGEMLEAGSDVVQLKKRIKVLEKELSVVRSAYVESTSGNDEDYARDNEELREKNEKLNKEILQLEVEAAELRGATETNESQCDELRKEVEALRQELADSTAQASELRKQVFELEDIRDDLERKMQEMNTGTGDADFKLRLAEEKVSVLTEQIAAMETEADETEAELDDVLAKLDLAVECQAMCRELEKKLEQAKEEKAAERASEIARIEASKKQLESEKAKAMTDATEQMIQFEKVKGEFTRKIKRLTDECAREQSLREDAVAQLHASDASVEVDAKMGEMHQELEAAQAKLTIAEQKISKLRDEVNGAAPGIAEKLALLERADAKRAAEIQRIKKRLTDRTAELKAIKDEKFELERNSIRSTKAKERLIEQLKKKVASLESRDATRSASSNGKNDSEKKMRESFDAMNRLSVKQSKDLQAARRENELLKANLQALELERVRAQGEIEGSRRREHRGRSTTPSQIRRNNSRSRQGSGSRQQARESIRA
ncbi:hypothetical protein SARC_04484 [Sphaeroforma arctica JP610]|uniref:Uncharacterized protein n=1 Tax=Sphaeroforma arctica JP610 TaxID=667725 RepID=A0A0L0G4T6_9EUKA|nr:hypothetical protein SARC_04484 [Sphaeroforma arctica JP610]KNC83268.1 hypothetical protein SARC_04484 [Sphaeroforma arctica JP610]|eukprot:XP_014157170.1 hypothetical protein SARC_04484 [Sphaeroforma arctica JP610]